ncbi:MAG: CinA family protein [Pseudomonadota bacterium]
MPLGTSQGPNISVLSAKAIARAIEHKLKITTAESCTGGLVGAALTDHPGSSSAFEYGFVVYANEAKSHLLNVDKTTISKYGAVSREVAQEMAIGALTKASADLSVAITGVAGPTGGTDGKPVGCVWFGVANYRGDVHCQKRLFAKGSRHFVRTRAVETALNLILQEIRSLTERN